MTDWYFILKDTLQGTYTIRIFVSFFEFLWLVTPYFIASVMINVLLRRFFSRKTISFSTGHEISDVVIAAFLGLISPLPTYIALPLGLSLLTTGIRISSVAAFILASPLMNIGIFYFTWSQLGLEIALVRVITALLIAIVGGILAGVFLRDVGLCMAKEHNQTNPTNRSIWLEGWRSLRFLGRYFLIAIFMSSIIKALIPANMISQLLGGNAEVSVIAAISLGVPFYTCGGAAIPLVAQLSEMGMNKGAVLAFFIAGPSTKPETFYVYKTLFGGYKIVLLYLAYSILGAFVSGLFYLNL